MKSRNKDRKPHESIIGKIIYGFLLFMPLLAIGVTCAYAIFNKNAYKSYSGEIENVQEIKSTNLDVIDLNYTYTLDIRNAGESTYNTCSKKIYFEGEELIEFFVQFAVSSEKELLKQANNFTIGYGVGQSFNAGITFLVDNKKVNTYFYNQYGNVLNQTFEIKITDIVSVPSYNQSTLPYGSFIKYIPIYTNDLSNIFYYSIDKVQESPLFNWAENSAIYTGMTATCNALNITTPFIPLLMTYWLIINVIYILYDIILVILHIFHNKIHQLEDSF